MRSGQLRPGYPDAREHPDRSQDPAAGSGLSLARPPQHAGLRQTTTEKAVPVDRLFCCLNVSRPRARLAHRKMGMDHLPRAGFAMEDQGGAAHEFLALVMDVTRRLAGAGPV